MEATRSHHSTHDPAVPTRRDFLRMAAAGLALTPTLDSARAAPAVEGGLPRISSDFLEIAFDPATGQFTGRRTDGALLFREVAAGARTRDRYRRADEPAYRHSIETERVRDDLGEGQVLRIRSTDEERQLDFEVRARLDDGRPAVLLEVGCRNASPKPLVVEHLDPIRGPGGILAWPDTSKVLTNGPSYTDPGRVIELDPAKDGEVRSWWNLALFRGYDREGLVAGQLDNRNGLGQVIVRRLGEAAFRLGAECLLAPNFELPPGQRIHSGRFLITVAPDPYTALESFADLMGRALGARTRSVVNGWCDWFFAFEHITEDEMVRNAEYAARHLKPYGLEYIQVDEGYQRWHGDWEGNDRFPHGMKWLADRIRSLGLKPGIWIAPYVISEPAEVFREHPEWLLHRADGRLQRVGPWPSEDSDWARGENPRRYGLDLTHPGAAAWLADLFDTVANRWGYDMVKVDFVEWSLLAAERYHEPTVSRAAAYRKGFEIMRRALGPDRHLQDCGPGPVTVGLLDSMRIELDQNYGFRQQAWKQYFLESASSAPAAAKRYYFHRRTWINDADHVCLNLLSLSQARAAATLIALTGGNVISGDRLTDLDASRLEILQKAFPSWGEAARPVDLFDSDRPGVFAVRIAKPWGEWTVAGFFNADETAPLERVLPLNRLWLDPRKTYLAYDFWSERLHGEFTGELRIRVEPESVLLLVLHEKQGVPQVLSADRHLLQGAWELGEVSWKGDRQTLSGVSLGPPNTAHNVTVFLPEPVRWRQGGPFLYHDFPGYTLKMTSEHLLRVRVRFADTNRVAWHVDVPGFLQRS